MANSSAEFTIKLQEEAALTQGTAAAAPNNLADQIDQIRRAAALLAVSDPRKSADAVEKMLADAAKLMIGEAAGRLGGAALAGITKQLVDSLIGKTPTADIIAQAQKMVALVPGVPAGAAGGTGAAAGVSGVTTPAVGPYGPLPADYAQRLREQLQEDLDRAAKQAANERLKREAEASLAGAVAPQGPIPVFPQPYELPRGYLGAQRLAQEEDRKKQRDQEKQATYEQYRGIYGRPSDAERDEIMGGRNRTLQQAGNLGMIAAGFGLPGGRAASSIAGGAFGGAQVGAMLGSASMAFPIAGAVMAVIGVVTDTVQKGLQEGFKIANKIMADDAMGFGRAIGDLAGNIPIFGGVIKTVIGGLFDLLEGVHQTAVRMSQYNGAIAMQLAQFQVQQQMRDIRRAQEFGPQVLAAEQEREDIVRQLQESMDEMLPDLLQVVREFAPLIPVMAQALARYLSIGLRGTDAVIAMATGMLPQYLAMLAHGVNQVADNTRPPGGSNPLEDIILNGPRPGEVRAGQQQQDLRAQAVAREQAAFPGL